MAKKHVQKRDADLNLVSELYLKGNSFRAIAKVLKDEHGVQMGHVNVFKIVQKLREEWREHRLSGMDSYYIDELERIDQLESTAWDAWEKSKKVINTRSRQKGTPGAAGGKTVTTTEVETTRIEQETPGDPRFLVIIHKCGDRRCRILGLYKQPEPESDDDSTPVPPKGQLPEQFSETPTFVIIGESKPMVNSEDDLPDYE